MGVALGWKEIAPQHPYIDGQLWNDSVTRNGNTISFSFNLQAHVRLASGYWNYAWYIDFQCGNVTVRDKLIKSQIYRNDVIGGQDYWYSTNNGNFTGTITVDGQATTIPVQVLFHDSAGNWGNTQTWYVAIPTATPMSAIRSSVSNLEPESARINASVDYNGSYSTITGWKLQYGKDSYYEHTSSSSSSALSHSWNLSGLEPSTYYMYKVSVTNSAGFTQTYSGTFYTASSVIANLLVEGQPTKLVSGYIIRPSGQVQRIKEIRRLQG